MPCSPIDEIAIDDFVKGLRDEGSKGTAGDNISYTTMYPILLVMDDIIYPPAASDDRFYDIVEVLQSIYYCVEGKQATQVPLTVWILTITIMLGGIYIWMAGMWGMDINYNHYVRGDIYMDGGDCGVWILTITIMLGGIYIWMGDVGYGY